VKIRSAAAFAFLLLAAGCVHVVHEQDLLPGAQIKAPPPSIPPNLEVQAADGSTLRGYAFTGENRRAVVVYFGGNGEIVGPEGRLPVFAGRRNVDIYAVNYRGFGPSGGTASLAAIHDDSLRVFDAVAARPEVHGRPIVVYGYSIGTIAALTVATSRPVAGVILQGAPTSAKEVVPTMKNAIPAPARGVVKLRASKELASQKPQPIDLAPKLTAPLLSLHGTVDDVVAIQFGKKIFDAAKSANKTWCPVEGAGHVDLWGQHGDAARACFDRFIAGLGASSSLP
jgi:pimeloyl-ACP methyl ester carboxylesterase